MDIEDFEVRPLKIFLSYSSADKVVVGEIKKGLESLDYEVFLAHEDIEPAEEWQDVILENLGTCDIFVPVLSQEFKDSSWTDQETGFALALGKLIVPIDLGYVPYGFISKYQALKMRDNVIECCRKVRNVIRKNPAFKEIYDNLMINAFVNSSTFNEANGRAEFLQRYEPFTNPQINEIIKGYLHNNQIRRAWRAKPNVFTWFEKYKEQIRPKLREQFEIFRKEDRTERIQATKSFLYEHIGDRRTTTDLTLKEQIDLPFSLVSEALKDLESEGRVISEEHRRTDGQRYTSYNLT